MRVTVRTFAQLRELSVDRSELELNDGATLAEAWNALEASHPALAPHRPYARGAHNGTYAPWDTPLAEGDDVAFMAAAPGG